MGTPTAPKPVKIFIALLASDEKLVAPAESCLEENFGPIDSAGPVLPWEMTDYYGPEMGKGLCRRFVSFGPLSGPERLPEIKLRAQEIEEEYAEGAGGTRRRRVNIDPGYLDAGKVVLASTKSAPHRLYLGSGIYGEITLVFQNGSFRSFAHTYQDYLWPETSSFFAALRSIYLAQLRDVA